MAVAALLIVIQIATAASSKLAGSCGNSLDREAALAVLQGTPEGRLASLVQAGRQNVSSCKDWDLLENCPAGTGHVSTALECRDVLESETGDFDSLEGLIGGHSIQGSCVCFERCACAGKTRSLRGAGLSSPSPPKQQQSLSGGAIAGIIIGCGFAAWLLLRFATAYLFALALEEERVLRDWPKPGVFSSGLFDVRSHIYICVCGACCPYELAAVNAHRAGILPFWIARLRMTISGPFYVLPEIRHELRRISGIPPSRWDCLLVQCCCCFTACQEARHIEKAYESTRTTTPAEQVPSPTIGSGS